MSTNTSELNAELRTAVARLYRRFRSERQDGELGDAAVAVLVRLVRAGPQSLSALSEHEHVTPGSMSQTVNRLTAAGYAVRGKDPDDGRRVLFTVTPEGERLGTAIRERSLVWFDGELARFTDEQRRILHEAAVLLTTIADSDGAA